jgi:60 kDa SS-A/Ro ribonucleoprotein
MAHNYSQNKNPRKTPQSAPIPGRENDQVKNNAGGYVFKISPWEHLKRFLILGSEGGTYYVSERKLTTDNIKNLDACINEDPNRVLNMVVDVSEGGKAPKNDPAIFVLAMLFNYRGDKLEKSKLIEALPKVCRIGTHLFTFTHYLDEMRSFGRGVRSAVALWYGMDPKSLEYQLVKYQGRTVEGTGNQWTHRDILRMAHVKPKSEIHDKLFKYAVKGEFDPSLDVIAAVEELKTLKTESKQDVKRAIELIGGKNLPHETWPTEFKNIADVWVSALPTMPLTATIRNLAKLTQLGILKTGKFDMINVVLEKLTNQEYIKKSRVHPINILMALKTYSQGQGFRGSLTWTPVQQIIDALDSAFYLSYGNVEPTGKNIMLALDVSGSMTSAVSGFPFLSCREVTGAVSLVTANVEKNYSIMGFTSGGRNTFNTRAQNRWGRDGAICELNISPKQRLNDVTRYMNGLPFSGTDCSLPMIYAKENNLKYDAFVVYTDNETWAGEIHASQALKQYRKQSGIDAKLVVVAMASSSFSIADPSDPGMLDVAGFSSEVPQLINSFITGEF